MEEILRLLEQDARTTVERVSELTGRPEEEVRALVEEAERRGIIRKYKTVVDWDRLKEGRVMAFIDVAVTPARGVGFDDVAERLYRFPEVRSLYLVSGEYDLRLIVEGSSLHEVASFVSEKLATVDRVRGTATHFLLKRYKEDGVQFAEFTEGKRLVVSP
ncbi:MAG: Lrp/AsnC family transcriptional regulator [Armatimonadetes bacterium]|nr:Lrp/AsnC family transcriptional regulator [Armatimonadota bacterium]